MPEHMWSILCQHAVVDRETNVASYLMAVEEVRVPSLPCNINMTLGSLWARSGDGAEELAIRYKLVRPSGKTSTSLNTLVMEKPRQRVNVKLSLLVEEEGVLRILVHTQVKGKWKQVAKIPVVVKLQGSEHEPADGEQ